MLIRPDSAPTLPRWPRSSCPGLRTLTSGCGFATSVTWTRLTRDVQGTRRRRRRGRRRLLAWIQRHRSPSDVCQGRDRHRRDPRPCQRSDPGPRGVSGTPPRTTPWTALSANAMPKPWLCRPPLGVTPQSDPRERQQLPQGRQQSQTRTRRRQTVAVSAPTRKAFSRPRRGWQARSAPHGPPS